MQIKNSLRGLTLLAGALAFAGSLTACTVSATLDCGPNAVDCGGFCADLSVDPSNCGACGVDCGGDQCIGGACVSTVCVPDGNPCASDGDCCSLFCASDGNCGCMPSGTGFCSADSDCCNGVCDFSTGICQ